jgi:recombination protein RecA
MVKQKSFLQDVIDTYGIKVLIKTYPDGYPTISTGSLAIDISTGIGGIPLGRYSEIYGPEAGGKTSLGLSICRQAILSGKKCLYIDVENSMDYGYAENILDELLTDENIIFLQPNSAEDSFTLAEKGIDSGFDCIIFDSVAAISPDEEVEKDYGKQSIGLAPRLTNQFLKKTRNKILDRGVAFVFTNQVRANIGSYMGGYITPAGYALKHYTSLRIYLSKSTSIEADGVDIGNVVNFTIKKNKMAVPFRTAETNIIYGKGIDYYRDVLKFGSLLGVIKAKGPYLAFEETVLGQGLAKSIETIKENQQMLDNIVEKCYNVAGVSYPPVRSGKVIEE